MPDEKEFVHLHVHTEFSLLDGFSRIKKLVNRAAATNMRSLAITDHGTMYGVIDFYRACKEAGIKPIIGMEAYLAPWGRSMEGRDSERDSKPSHLLLLARNETGYKNLLQIASASQLNGFYFRPRIDHDFLREHAEGLIATSGCLAAEIPRLIERGQEAEARQRMGWYQDTFGRENFFLELQHHNIEQLHILNRWLVEEQGYANIPLVATNDVHYVLEEDYDTHDTLLCIQTGSTKAEQNRLRFESPTFHLRTPEEMWRLFAHVPEALNNTLLIAEMCDVNLDSEGYHLPVFPVLVGYTPRTYLRSLCERGLVWRYGEHANDPVVRERLDYELHVIHDMGFDTYFLIVWDLCEFARHANIWWNVRGSGAGSVAAYTLGLTNIDPLQNNLLFERFLNPGRKTMPDIDLDFPEDRRAEMIEYCAKKYGEDKVAAIITFGTLGSKAAIRDVGRAFDLPPTEVDRIARLIPTAGKPIKFDDALGDDPEKALPDLKAAYANDPTAHKLIDAARELEGITRHASTHAAGVIVADRPLVEYIPLHRPTKGSAEDAPVKMVTQFPMETCESIGLLKVDFLGLSTLTIMRKACDLIERYHGIHYTLDNIPYRPDSDDPVQAQQVAEMFEMIGRGETIGVFQLESQGMRRMLTDMRPKRFENIVAAVALYRPGPMEYIPTYNRRLHGDEEIIYRHPNLRPILEETYGICISGDSLVIDARTGQRRRVDELANAQQPFYIQGVDADLKPAVGRVSYLINNGQKPVFRVTLRSGATIKATHDHRFLTEDGWKPLDAIGVGDYLATPAQLLEPTEPLNVDRAKLRVLAYLLADGSLGSGSSVDFVNKDPLLIEEYERCLSAFDDLEPVHTLQIHDVVRVGVRSRSYKSANSLLAWMRELGLKAGPGTGYPRGARSHEKAIPAFVFQLGSDDLAFFLASLWDCDGHFSRKLCHYKTISAQLAQDVQTLLLRLGISSVIHTSTYASRRGTRTAYQVTVCDTVRLRDLLGPHLLTEKKAVVCTGRGRNTLRRERFLDEVSQATDRSARQLMADFGIDRQHFYHRARENRERIAAHVVAPVAEALSLTATLPLLNVQWQEVVAIEPAGIEAVYDLTVEGIHNFVANNIVVHNCVYQEQIMQIAGQLFGYALGEADLMRRAVSKKKAKDLIKHRQIFAERGPERGVDAATANAIFDDIEFFARYGFNKSHAADYAVLTCQTAFLKCHYPHEYMAALMSVHRDDSGKVGLFAADCHRMGIAVLPPTVNGSLLDFSIEQNEDSSHAIRFGLGAVKNVGVVPLEHIIDQREHGGPFRNLDDFCRRVDMRIVNKRALESLIKVGALDEFAPRPVLLAALDRIVSFSAEQHKAQDSGQMSLFGEATGVSFGAEESILSQLHDVDPVPKREMLNWEKELVGLYVTDHPLKGIMADLERVTTHTNAELIEAGEAVNGQSVRVAGLVTSLRSFFTKKGDAMAVINLEDVTGTISAVLFPRTWTEYRGIVDEDAVVILYGKVDTTRGDTQIIVDQVKQEMDVSVLAEPLPELQNLTLSWMEPAEGEPSGEDSTDDATYDDESDVISSATPLDEPPPPTEPVLPASAGASSAAPPPIVPPALPAEEPPPPAGLVVDREMPGWLDAEDNGWSGPTEWEYREDTGHIIGVMGEHDDPDSNGNGNGNGNGDAPHGPSQPTPAFDAAGRLMPPPAPALRPQAMPPASAARDTTEAFTAGPHRPRPTPPPAPIAGPSRLLTLYVPRTGDSARDRALIRRLHGFLTQFPGPDRFRFILESGGKRAYMEFPKHAIHINDEILTFAARAVGEENVVVGE